MSRRMVAGAVAALACTLGFALAGPGPAAADCGGTVTSAPSRHPPGQPPPLALGDSTMLLSLPGLSAAGYDGNAHGCRQLAQALPLLAVLRKRGRLPHMVAIALGSNCCATAQQIDQALAILGPRRLLVLVTPVHAGATDALERRAARAHPGRILLLDWMADSAGHGAWFQPDGLHLTMPGVDAFTRLLTSALPYAYEPCPPTTARLVHRAPESTPPALTLALSDRVPGWIGAQIGGPPGAAVSLTEQRGTTVTPLATVTLPASGTLTVAQLAPWLCAPRSRTVTAMAPGAPGATSQITTPSCAGRLRVRSASTGRVGTSLAFHVSDRWRTGGVALRICTTPPGGVASCRAGRLAPGRSAAAIRVVLQRPGGWTVAIGTGYGRPVVSRAWASHPGGRISMLAAGDSEMQILDDLLRQELGPRGVAITGDARVSTGLTSPFLFDWQREAGRKAAALRPDLSVVFIGANDGFAVAGPGGRRVQCCGSAWSAGYADLVAEMMRTLLRGSAGRVYWFLLPTPRPAGFQALFDGVNAGIRLAARRFPGRVGLIDANALFTPGNRYRDRMTYRGRTFTIHESDGIHLSAAADAVAAQLVLRRLRADHVIR